MLWGFLGAVLWSLLWLLLAVFVVALVLLATPLCVRISAATEPQGRVRVWASTLGGWTPEVRLHDSARKVTAEVTGKTKEKIPDETKPRKKKKRGGGMSGKTGLRLARNAPGLLSGLLRRFRLTRLSASFGLGDPADTGQVFGMLTPLLYALPGTPITLRPDFGATRVTGAVDATIRVIPGSLAVPLIGFGWRVFVPWGRE